MTTIGSETVAIRNFWIEARIDGRKTVLKGGPRGKDEGFEIDIYQRSSGDRVRILEVTGTVKWR